MKGFQEGTFKTNCLFNWMFKMMECLSNTYIEECFENSTSKQWMGWMETEEEA